MARTTDRLILAGGCPLTGRPCPQAQHLADLLASALVLASDAAGPEISLAGAVETLGCGRGCRLEWTGTDAAIAVQGAPGRPGADGAGTQRAVGRLS